MQGAEPMERKPFLRIIPQAYEHADAEIVGDRTALELLIEGLEEALDEGIGSSGPFSDGEREFEVHFVCEPPGVGIMFVPVAWWYDLLTCGCVKSHALLPYTDPDASGKRDESTLYPFEHAARLQEVPRERLKELLRRERQVIERGGGYYRRGCFGLLSATLCGVLHIHGPGTVGDRHAWIVGMVDGIWGLLYGLQKVLNQGEFKVEASAADRESYDLFLRMVEEGSGE
jgi:hypothetical protein